MSAIPPEVNEVSNAKFMCMIAELVMDPWILLYFF